MALRHWLLFFALGTIAGTGFMWTKLALQELSPLNLLVLRFSVGSAFLAAGATLFRVPLPRRGAVWGALVVLGVFNVAVPHFLIAWGQQHVTSAMAGVLNATTPLFTLFIAHLLLHDDRLSLPKLVGASVSFLGVVVTLSRNLGPGLSGGLLGQLAILGATFSFAASSVVARRFAAGTHPAVQALGAAAVAGLTATTAVLLAGVPIALPQRPLTWLAVLMVGLLNNGLTYMVFFHLLNTIGPSRTQTVGYLIPLVAVTAGVVVLGEPLHWRLVLGGALILLGIATVHATRAQRERVPEAPPTPRPGAAPRRRSG